MRGAACRAAGGGRAGGGRAGGRGGERQAGERGARERLGRELQETRDGLAGELQARERRKASSRLRLALRRVQGLLAAMWRPSFEGDRGPEPVATLRAASGPRGAAPSATPGAEPVDAAVFCPPRVAKGSDFLVQVFLYQPDAAEEEKVGKRAREADAAAKPLGGLSLLLDLPHGAHVDLHVEMPGLVVAEPDATLVWRGKPVPAQFQVAVPADVTVGEVIGSVRFAVAGLPVGTLRFKIALAATGTATTEPASPREAEVVRYRTAFASYSSEDLGEVLKRVQGANSAGLKVYLDALGLEPGQRWERELYRHIKDCDVFLLFWSRSAAASEWVAKEIAYALDCQGGLGDNPPAIQPVPLEGPPPPPPPDVLRHLHFNDALLAHIHAAASHRP